MCILVITPSLGHANPTRHQFGSPNKSVKSLINSKYDVGVIYLAWVSYARKIFPSALFRRGGWISERLEGPTKSQYETSENQNEWMVAIFQQVVCVCVVLCFDYIYAFFSF